ncbi:hypothetical protein [Photobacterium damselae]|uniref:hypothetical protein n=1 Tax=Photobacterium damselae TaxID=38293 RepID=UPI0030F3902D
MADILNITGNETVEELDAMLAMYDDAGVEENGTGVIEGSKGVIDQGNDTPNQDNANRSEVDSHAAWRLQLMLSNLRVAITESYRQLSWQKMVFTPSPMMCWSPNVVKPNVYDMSYRV